MSSNEPEANDVIDVQEAAKRLGITPLFLRWSLDAGLPLVIQGKHGRWGLTLGQSDGHPLVPGTEALEASVPPSLPEHGRQDSSSPNAPAESIEDLQTPLPDTEAADEEPGASETEKETPKAIPLPEAAEELPSSEQHAAPGGHEEGDTAHLLEEVAFLRRQVEFHSRVSSEKDRLIADLSLRLGQLGEETVKHFLAKPAQTPLGSQSHDTPTAWKANAVSGPDGEQQEINTRHEQAIRSIRDTLILVRNYLSQIDDRHTFNGGDEA